MKKNYLLFLFSMCFVWISQSQITLTQTTSNNIVPGTVACHANDIPDDNQYFRAFDIAALGYSQFDVSQVSFGVETAATIAAGFAVNVTIYSNSGGAFPAGTRTVVSTVSVPILASDANTIKTVPILASVVAPAQLIVEINIPDELAAMSTTQFFIGSNSAGQSAPGYFSSAGCGLPISTLTAVGFPNVHIILNVTGIALSVDEFSVSKVSISPNPTSDFVNIELHPSNTINSIEIYSITGRLVNKMKNNTRVDVSNLQSGVYLMKIETTNGSTTKKLIRS